MPFDMGFDFRDTAVFVTDPAYAVPVLTEAFPHLYTNANGYSINAGWVNAPDYSENSSNTNDPRIAGINSHANSAGGPRIFQWDLSSGSAPGAGIYTIDLAAGYNSGNQTQDFKVLDGATVLIDGTGGGAGIATPPGHYVDATLTDRAASTTWAGATVNKTFATTTVKLAINYDVIDGATTIAHFRLTLVPAAAGAARPTPAQLRRQELLGVRGWHG